MAKSTATKDELFQALINIHQINSNTDTSVRTDMVESIDSITEEVFQVIPDADDYLETESDEADGDETESDEADGDE